MNNTKRIILAVIGVLALIVSLVACAVDDTHQSSPNPAEVKHQEAHEVLQLPDGFRNVAETCDSGGNMILVTSRGQLLDNNSGGALPSGIAVIVHDPRCSK